MSTKDKIAIMIFAHKDFIVLERLISSLQHDAFDIFVHLSYYSLFSEFERDEIKKYRNVKIVPFSVKTNLDEFSLVESVLKTIKYAGLKYKYYVKLSGQDYPIKPVESFINHLNSIYPHAILDCTPYDKSNWIYYKLHQPRWYSYLLLRARKYIKVRFIKRLILIGPYFISKLLDKITNYGKKSKKLDLKIYGGSPMWVLPDVIIEDIIEFSDKPKNKAFNLLKKIWTPEEVFFQTVAMLSEKSNLISVNSIDTVSQNCQTYNYFTDIEKPFMGHPYILTEDNLSLLQSLPYYFARKFSSEVDTKILDLIDENIINI